MSLRFIAQNFPLWLLLPEWVVTIGCVALAIYMVRQRWSHASIWTFWIFWVAGGLAIAAYEVNRAGDLIPAAKLTVAAMVGLLLPIGAPMLTFARLHRISPQQRAVLAIVAGLLASPVGIVVWMLTQCGLGVGWCG